VVSADGRSLDISTSERWYSLYLTPAAALSLAHEIIALCGAEQEVAA
jgi:hypothetical protein